MTDSEKLALLISVIENIELNTRDHETSDAKRLAFAMRVTHDLCTGCLKAISENTDSGNGAA